MQQANNYVSQSTVKKLRVRPFFEDAIVFAKVGAAISHERKRIALSPFLIDNNMMAFTPKQKEDLEFIYHLFQKIKLSKYSQVGALPSYNASDILDIRTFYPTSGNERKKIVTILSLVDNRIEKQSEIINNLKKYKRGLISDILKQNLAVSHESEKWEEVSLNDVADGFEYGMNAAATTFDGAHKYIRITDIDDDSHTYIDCDPVSPSGVLEEKYRVRDNDILFARTGASVGKSYLYRKTDGDLFFAGFLIRIHVKDGIDSEYVFLNTLTEEYAKWVLLESARSGQPGINAEQYRRYRFKLPSLRIQKRIASIAQKLDSQIQRESMCLHLLQEQKLGLLQQLFI